MPVSVTKQLIAEPSPYKAACVHMLYQDDN